jgi:hypothetical protein
MRADSASSSAETAAIVGVRSGTVLDPKLVAALRAVAARSEVVHRVLAILEPIHAPTSRAPADRHGR